MTFVLFVIGIQLFSLLSVHLQHLNDLSKCLSSRSKCFQAVLKILPKYSGLRIVFRLAIIPIINAIHAILILSNN